MMPTYTITIELPAHFFSEIEPIFRAAARTNIATFRGNVAEIMADTFQKLEMEYREYVKKAANASSLGHDISTPSADNIAAI